MGEEEETQEEEETESQEDTGTGVQPTADSIVDRAYKENERMEINLKKMEELQIRQEELYAKQQLGGHAEAGAVAPKPVQISDKEFAEKVQRGEINPLSEDGFV